MSERFRRHFPEVRQPSLIGTLRNVRTAKSYGTYGRRVLSTTALLMFVLNAGLGERVQAQDIGGRKPQVNLHDQSRHVLADSSSVRLYERSRDLIIPRIDFKNSTVRECIDFLRETSGKVDNLESDPINRGFNFVLKLTQEAFWKKPRVTFQAENLSLLDAMKEITRQTDLGYRLAPYAIEIGNANSFTAKLANRSFAVPPGVFPECQVHFGKGSELANYVRCD